MILLVGPNGAGKTTLLRTLLGEFPHSGELQFVSFDATRRVPRVGYVPQRLDIDALAPVSVLDLFAAAVSQWPIWLGRTRRARETALSKLGLVGSEDLVDRKLGRLSGGQLQRVLLALALTPAPDILVLDEPVAAVDRTGTRLFYEAISRLREEHDLCVLITAHELSVVASLADRMLVLSDRTILRDGPPREVLADAAVGAVLGFRVDLGSLPVEYRKHRPHGDPAAEATR